MLGTRRRESNSYVQLPRTTSDHNPILASHEESKGASASTFLKRARRRMRSRQVLVLIAIFAFVGISLLYLRGIPFPTPSIEIPHHAAPPQQAGGELLPTPEPPKIGSAHPIWELIKKNEQEFEKKFTGQSKTLAKAVTEYRRRYGIPPPPKFDIWYEYAKKKGVQMIDDYDTIHHSLLPFWALQPRTIRKRAQEGLGYDPNNLMGVLVRTGKTRYVSAGQDWLMEAVEGMMKDFVQHLPDMDLAFNIHDEPRVVLPYDDLRRLVAIAKEKNMPAANAVEKPRNSFSRRPVDVSPGNRFEDYKTTRFNVFAHQPTWTHSRTSCPPDSPSRLSLEDVPAPDNNASYAIGELGFIYNETAFSDVCQSPSFSQSYGFFDRPNSYNIVQDLFPVFSQSKLSTYADILYPSPWYWVGKVKYNETADRAWAEKIDKIYWRGSTTGGFSRDGGWRRQHRQHVVQRMNAFDQAKILVNVGDSEQMEEWKTKEVARTDYNSIFDIFFSHVGQCDDNDCKAQKQFFDIKGTAKQQDAWKYKYLLDMDGNAFSGRFYAFLKSKSLVYKMAVFKEWHAEWLKPWVHYVPLSLKGDEWIEAVRWFAGEPTGEKEAERLALQGRDWADKVLRNEDLEVWFFRLLLEYGRLVDDDREIIGYAPA
ncbi:glycosyltransferase family 90 protein [Amylocarpus encephaloides]|uniref:Glycosyltransferase family 90 protein n=1 Tax=Amylocarpus encephaloides TaxID=45428 RepID=A0A9P7YDX3_9HELO|nr:glycosyltransferase family 90 protein [Amylocarpus encephaloides]